jgi:ABC-2 type transport system ATP-binding protein
MNTTNPAVIFDAVSRRFGDFLAVDDVSFSVAPGEFFGLLGPNGAGKTTLISILGGLTRATSGTARVMGYDVTDDYLQARANLGVVPQEVVYDPFFTVRETLRLQAGYFGLRKIDGWIDELLHNLALTDKADTNMRALSGGMRRRVLIAQALVHKPPVIVLDEPTAGVDVELRHTLWSFITRLNREGHTIMLTTHYLEEAQALCGRIAMLKQGKIVALDDKKNLLKRFSGGIHVYLKTPAPALPSPWQERVVRRLDGDLRLLTLSRYDEIEPLLQSLREHNVGIDSLRIEEVDLEEIFLQLTS